MIQKLTHFPAWAAGIRGALSPHVEDDGAGDVEIADALFLSFECRSDMLRIAESAEDAGLFAVEFRRDLLVVPERTEIVGAPRSAAAVAVFARVPPIYRAGDSFTYGAEVLAANEFVGMIPDEATAFREPVRCAGRDVRVWIFRDGFPFSDDLAEVIDRSAAHECHGSTTFVVMREGEWERETLCRWAVRAMALATEHSDKSDELRWLAWILSGEGESPT